MKCYECGKETSPYLFVSIRKLKNKTMCDDCLRKGKHKKYISFIEHIIFILLRLF